MTRLVLEHKSECGVSPIENFKSKLPSTPSEGCWHPKTFDKAVIIIMDALRYDFTVPFQPSHDNEKPYYFHNALLVLHETATKRPDSAFLLPFIADPPTTTLQRLKGLTTGTLPTFIDAGSNFAGTAIEEDNLVAQLRDAGKRLVHLGDDTWHSLFPGYFDANLTRAYDSFNVWDLHTVDNGVTEHLIPLLHSENSSKWDVIFGHYLGVDHAGHRYGPDHPAMTAKLQQMDSTIRNIMDLVDDKTLLVIMGDHGMDAKGDHGGESDDEVEAALWMYSKKGIFGRTDVDFFSPPKTAKERPVGQIDLVPTLSFLLGMPIPFNNLGSPIDEAFAGKSGRNWENLATVNRITAAQIKRYQHEYAIARGLDESTTSGPLALYGAAENEWVSTIQSRRPSATQHQTTHAAFKKYQRETLSICRSLWARFDVTSMILGIIMLAAVLILLVLFSQGLRSDRTRITLPFLRRIASGSTLGAAASVAQAYILPSTSMMNSLLWGLGAGSIGGAASAILTLPRRLEFPIPRSIWGWLAFVFTISQSIGFASNSYTIWEDEILLFFLTTFGIIAAMSSMRQSDPADMALGLYQSVVFVLLTRHASLSRLCREEQMPICRSTYYASATSSTSAPWQLLIPFLLALLLPSVIKSYYKRTRSYEGSAIFWIGFAFRIGLLLVAIFWTLDAADDGDWLSVQKSTLKTSRVILAQLVLAIAFAAGTSTFVWAKPCVSIGTTFDRDSNPSSSSDGSLRPSPDTATAPKSPTSLTIFGYANVHGTRYLLLLTNFVLAISLVQKPMGAGAIGILTWQILSLVEILDTNALTSTNSSIGPIVLALLGSFHFFKTGHQATLSSIQWESAFIPLHTIRYPWSPLLVILNHFGAQIITAVAVPLTVLWKRPISQDKSGQRTATKGLLNDVTQAAATHILYYATVNLATTMWAGWLRRHLMLYRIFSPRFMLAAAVLAVVDLVVVSVAVGGVRWSTMSVGEVFGW